MPAAGDETMSSALLRRSAWIALGAFVVPLAVLLYLDRQYDVLSAIPLKGHPTPPLIAFLLLGTLGFPLGACVLISALADRMRADLSLAWPTARGRILHSEATMRLGKGARHHPDISYEYDVAGKRYTSSLIRFSGAHFRSNDGAQRVVERYPVGAEVPVRYDPENPALAVLESSPAGATQAIWLGASFLLLPFLGFVQAFRDMMNN
jgi:hypothetical protein